MFISKDFVYLGMPKTGSKWVSKILSRNFKPVYPTKSLPEHGGFEDIPERFDHLHTFGVIREVDSWCLSAYNHFLPWVLRESIPKGYERYYEEVERHGVHLEALYDAEMFRMFGEGTAVLRFEHLREDLRDYLMPYMSGSMADRLENDINTLQPVNVGKYQENQVARFYHT